MVGVFVMVFHSHCPCDAELGTRAATQADIRVDMAIGSQNVLFDDPDGVVRAIEITGLATGAVICFDQGFLLFCVFSFFGGPFPTGIDDGSPGAGFETGSAIDAKKGIDIEARFHFTVNGMLGAFFGARSAPPAIATDLVGHKMSNPGVMVVSGTGSLKCFTRKTGVDSLLFSPNRRGSSRWR